MAVDNSQLFDMYRSTGSYRLFVNNSTLPDLPARKTRLVATQFKRGPINKAVYIENVQELNSVFGQRDKRLEKNGCFGHLICQQMLAVAPIYVINLRNMNDTDMLQRISLGTNPTQENIGPVNTKFTSIYDTSNFWVVEPLMLLNAYGTQKAEVLNFATITNQNVSIFVVPTANRNYDYTIQQVQDRFPSMFVPTVKCEDLVSRYMVDVYFFSQDLTNFAELAGSAKFGKYFTADGIRKTVDGESGLSQLAKVTEAGYIGRVTGSLIPDLLDINGNKLSIESAINSVMDTTGIVCKINPDAVDQFYNSNDIEGNRFQRSIDLFGGNNVKVEDHVPSLSDNKFEYLGYVFDASETGEQKDAVMSPDRVMKLSYHPIDLTAEQCNEYVFNKFTGAMIPVMNGSNSLTNFYGPKLPLSINDYFVGKDGNPVRLVSKKTIAQYQALPAINTNELPLQTDGTPFPKNAEGVWVYPMGEDAWAGQPVEFGENGRPLDKPLANGGVEMAAVEPDEEHMKALYAEYGELLPIVDYEFDGELCEAGTYNAEDFECFDALGNAIKIQVSKDFVVYRYTPLSTIVDSYKGWYLKGVALRADQFVDGTRARQNEILSGLISGGVYKSLMDANQIKFRYIVDTFKTYIEGNAKYQFSKICNDTKRALAFSSQPTKYQMMTSTDPYFKKTPDGVLDASIVVEGGNTDMPYSVLFSFAGQDYGAPFIGYFANVRYNDGIDDMIIPATGIISNAYMRKFNEAGKHAWDIVAGDEWPIAGEGVTDVDWVVSQGHGSDLDSLEPAGWNMLQRDDTGNITILAERTAQNSFLSAFSYLSTLDLCIYIADEVEPILKAKHYKRNTAETRLDALTRADAIYSRIQAQGGIESYELKCDSENNTKETIGHGMLVMDSTITVSPGISISVQRIEVQLAGD